MEVTEDSFLRKFRYVWTVCRILALVPTHTINMICAVIAIVLGYSYFIYGQCTDDRFKSIIFTVRIIDNTAVAFLTLSVLSITTSAWYKREEYWSFLRKMERFDKTMETAYPTRRLLLGMAVMNVYTLVVIATDFTSFGVGFGFTLYKFYLPRNLLWYVVNFAISAMCFMAYTINYRFQTLNEALERDYLHIGAVKAKKGDQGRNFRMLFNDLYDMVDNYNDLFGLNWLLIFMFGVAIIVQYVHMVVVYSLYQQMRVAKVFLVIDSILWVSKMALQILYIASICDHLTKQSKRTIVICNKLLSSIPSLPHTHREMILREELIGITKQGESRAPSISAAGFYDINFGMMGSIVGSVTSYTIISIQFVGGDRIFKSTESNGTIAPN